jgi:hypothetical protein
MAWIEQHRRADGGLTARVIWRPGGARDAIRVWETFGAGSDAQNLARADGFKRMVEAAGQRWPDGWVKGEGFVRPPDVADPMTPPPSFDKIGEEYVRQIVDLSPGQRKRGRPVSRRPEAVLQKAVSDLIGIHRRAGQHDLGPRRGPTT